MTSHDSSWWKQLTAKPCPMAARCGLIGNKDWQQQLAQLPAVTVGLAANTLDWQR